MVLNHIRPTRAEVNLDNLKHNLKEIRRITSPDACICAVVKANGYGHGAIEIADTALSFGASYLAVAVIDEAVELRQKGIQAPILVLGYTPEKQFDEVIEYNITQTVYSLESAQLLAEQAKKNGKKAVVHIKLDTGMSRLGFRSEVASIPLIEKLFLIDGLCVEGIFSHFAKADEKDKEFTEQQFKNFINVVSILEKDGYKIPIKHIANSAAIIDLPYTHLDMVRPGIILYGLYPSKEVDKTKIQLKPVMSLKTRISHVKNIGLAWPCYGGKFITQRKSIIATLPVDMPMDIQDRSSHSSIMNGYRAPLVGNICMISAWLMLLIYRANVEVGDDVVLFGEMGNQTITVDEIADKIGTINYEVVCGVSKRVPRVYINDGKVVDIKTYL